MNKTGQFRIPIVKGVVLLVDSSGAPLFEEVDAADYGESRWQLQEGQCELECIVEDEDGWTGLDDIWEDTFAEYIKPYVAKLLEEDEDAMVYAVNFHN